MIEMVATVCILAILITILVPTWETYMSAVRYSKAKADMNAIAYAGYMDYANRAGTENLADVWAISDNPWTPPTDILQSGNLPVWPAAPCPSWYYSWDNGATFGLNAIRVTLRRPDDSPLWSYCVNSFASGQCDAADLYNPLITPIEITTANVRNLYCYE
jgi:type II secretory pathway pseudopilin PulG